MEAEAEDGGEFVEKDPSGRYGRYDEVLGEGAFKTVYKAFDEIQGIEVAWNRVDVEHFSESPALLRRLYEEVNVLRSVKHGNIIRFYHSWVDEETRTINIITELFTSGNLRQYRKKHKHVDMKAIKNWGRQILQGIQYLHGHDPPIIHRDLKCENIFVNGYDGHVKIGDLGLAIVMQQPTAHSVIGTPEFMAPELYEEDYNELVDVYSFGMCMLEMITLECPYGECKNSAQIYKKVLSGVKPLSLGKVKDPDVKQFIEKCLLPATSRPSAAELLRDPFLAIVDSKALKKPETVPKSLCPSNEGGRGTAPSSGFELRISSGCNEFRLAGERSDEASISLTLHIVVPEGKANKIQFAFYLDSDTVVSVAQEMMEQLDLPKEDADVVAELMDRLIVKMVPGWKACASEQRQEQVPQPLASLNSQILKCSFDLLSPREEIVENNRKKWMGKKGIPVI